MMIHMKMRGDISVVTIVVTIASVQEGMIIHHYAEVVEFTKTKMIFMTHENALVPAIDMTSTIVLNVVEESLDLTHVIILHPFNDYHLKNNQHNPLQHPIT